MTAIVGLIAAVVSAFSLLPTDGASPNSGTSITSPGQFVDYRETLSGTTAALSGGDRLWALTWSEASGRFYPQDHPCQVVGVDFYCGDYWIGSPGPGGGERFAIYVVAAPASAVETFMRYQIDKGGPGGANPGLSALPVEVSVLAHVNVVRNPS